MLLWLIETDVFQMPQLHKHFNVGRNYSTLIMDSEKDWKLKLKYGKLTTPYKHYTLIAHGVVGSLVDGFECREGNAYMGIKVWATSEDEAFDMIQSIGDQIGFSVTGKIELLETDPEQRPAEEPFGYDINFTPFD